MKLSEYFESAKGRGVLATADAEGRVDAAVYARPHFIDDETVAFIMRDRLTHHNIQSNPHAAYLFMEAGEKVSGKRLFLTKTGEEKDSELLYALRRRQYPDEKNEPKFLVFFRIDKVLPLIGSGPDPRTEA
ncbi:MAG: pyridoxamine 5'-phosphate oxidase family protein [Syntrophobacteria bacterium]